MQTKLLDIYAESLCYTDDMVRSEQAYRKTMRLLKEALQEDPDRPKILRRHARSEWALAEALAS